jgi:hypothetical protein
MRQDNVILFGSRHSNPWANTYENICNFRFENSLEAPGAILNLKPRAGERPVYRADPVQGGTSYGYALAVFVSNLARTGNVLCLEGTEGEGTEAAGQFVLSEESLARLRAALPKRNSESFPHFEVLLRTTRMSGTPRGAEIVAVRTQP